MVASSADPAPRDCVYDCVLVDDDELVRLMWRMAAERVGKRLLVTATWQELSTQLPGLSKAIPIYIDYNLVHQQGSDGAARQLVAAGFSSVYLQTGYDVAAIPAIVRSLVKGVVGKEPPWP